MARARRQQGNGLMLLGMLAGAAIGAAVGLFYTPASGEENRKRIARWVESRGEDVKERVKREKLTDS